MGDFAEECALKHNIPRKEQDLFAAESYRRSLVRVQHNMYTHDSTMQVSYMYFIIKKIQGSYT
jgi:acetyl-CoA acetyltransferase